MGIGWLDFRSKEQKERDFRDFSERVFSGGLPHKRQVRERLREVSGVKDVTYLFLYYVALKDLLVRKPKLSFEEGLSQVCAEIQVMKHTPGEREAIRQVLKEDMDGKLGAESV